MNLSKKIQDTYGSKKGFLYYLIHTLKYKLNIDYTQYEDIPKNVTRYVFVCKGNICRSALAETIAKNSKVSTSSFGIDTTSGCPADKRAIQIAKKIGLDLSSHKTTAIEDFTPKPGDLYICMEPDHINGLKKALPSVKDIILLGLIGHSKNPYIHDPYSSNSTYFENCAKTISKRVANILNHPSKSNF